MEGDENTNSGLYFLFISLHLSNTESSSDLLQFECELSPKVPSDGLLRTDGIIRALILWWINLLTGS